MRGLHKHDSIESGLAVLLPLFGGDGDEDVFKKGINGEGQIDCHFGTETLHYYEVL